MIIDRVTMRHVKMKLLRPFTTSFGSTTYKEFILLEMVCRDGAIGWGESTAFVEPSYNEETLKTNWHMIESFLLPLLTDVNINHPNEVSSYFSRIRGNNMAKAAVEGAVWDLYANREGISLAKAVGGVKERIDVGVSIGIKPTVEQLLDEIERNVEQGYKRVKIKIQPGWDVAVVAKVRERFPDILLMADANSAYSLRDAEHLKQLDAFNLMMIEQPLAHDDIIDHRELQMQLQTPICLDESIHSAEDARKAIQLGSCKIINLKIGRVGGIAESIKLHDLCQQRGVPVWCGGMLESGVGRAHNIAITTLPNFTMPGDTAGSANYWDEDIIEPEVVVRDGTIEVPVAPGIGYVPHMERIRQFTEYEQVYRLR